MTPLLSSFSEIQEVEEGGRSPEDHDEFNQYALRLPLPSFTFSFSVQIENENEAEAAAGCGGLRRAAKVCGFDYFLIHIYPFVLGCVCVRCGFVC